MVTAPSILVVDDDPSILETIQEILVSQGYQVDLAEHGLKALNKMENRRYDLVLSDVVMPEMGGMELLQQISLRYPETVTIMLTGHANIKDAVAAIRLGAYDYIAKPVNSETLILAIERALQFKALQKASLEMEWTLKYLDRLSSSVSMGLAVADHNLRLRSANPNFAKLLDQRETDFHGASILSLFQGLSTYEKEKINRAAQAALETPDIVDCGSICLDNDYQGNSYLTVKMAGIHHGNSSPQLLVIVEDITEIEQLQQRLSFCEHLAIMGKLSACVVHELNNPLDGVQRYVSLALLRKEDSGEVERYLTEAQKGLNKISLAVNSMLNANNPNRLLKAQDNLLNQLREAIKILVFKANEQRVQIVLSLPPIFEEIIMANDIYSVFVNLIKNALQAMPDGGKLKIVGMEEVGQIKMHFIDNGKGIDWKDQKNIFKPFYTTKNHGQGLGLGLPICQHIMEKYQGRIKIKSDPQQGTTVTLEIPQPGMSQAGGRNYIGKGGYIEI